MSPYRLPNYSSISEWSQILSIPDVTFINLQSKDFADDLTKVREELGVTVHNFDDLDQWNDIDDVAVGDGSEQVDPADLTNSMAAYTAAISKTKDIKLSNK